MCSVREFNIDQSSTPIRWLLYVCAKSAFALPQPMEVTYPVMFSFLNVFLIIFLLPSAPFPSFHSLVHYFSPLRRKLSNCPEEQGELHDNILPVAVEYFCSKIILLMNKSQYSFDFIMYMVGTKLDLSNWGYFSIIWKEKSKLLQFAK